MGLTDRNPPRTGTRSAVTYWAARTREALRFSEAMLAESDPEAALSWANDADGCGGEFANAVTAYTQRAWEEDE